MSQTIAETEQLLLEAIVKAKQDLKESAEIDPNSYGAGYDGGYLAGLRESLRIVMGTT